MNFLTFSIGPSRNSFQASIHKEQSWLGAKLLKLEMQHPSAWNMAPSKRSSLFAEKVYIVFSCVIHKSVVASASNESNHGDQISTKAFKWFTHEMLGHGALCGKAFGLQIQVGMVGEDRIFHVQVCFKSQVYASLDLFNDWPHQREIVHKIATSEWTTCTLSSSPFELCHFAVYCCSFHSPQTCFWICFIWWLKTLPWCEALDRWCSYIRPDVLPEDHLHSQNVANNCELELVQIFRCGSNVMVI